MIMNQKERSKEIVGSFDMESSPLHFPHLILLNLIYKKEIIHSFRKEKVKMLWSLASNETPVPPHSHYNPLNEPSSLGLKLKKSRSLLKLYQASISQAPTVSGVGISGPDVNARVGILGTDVNARVVISGSDVNARVGISGPDVKARVGISGSDVKARAGISGSDVKPSWKAYFC
ncbi:hypothetical protein L1987_16973 [Smallanthus sonchifolius]|uniref:Uncharacterized protein n=1 Tax=Smallanthus sonchifolius TaxID=185202 RepID=A0ACB9IXT3_9ASTR|nr:hypothetical protein L1987_16973 [Smallanthus sonchifolius]